MNFATIDKLFRISNYSGVSRVSNRISNFIYLDFFN